MKCPRDWSWLAALGLLMAPACGGQGGAGNSAGSGGAYATGGASGFGGVKATGGSGGGLAAGGTTSTGGRSGGGTSGKSTGGAGGVPSSGGTMSTGGAASTGGLTSAGGAAGGDGQARDGAVAAGGRRDAGPSPMGGSSATGGALGNGGNSGGISGTSGSGGIAGAGGSIHVGKWQLMPLGDSITGTTCYPKLLAKELTDKGYDNFDFVGTVLNNQSCGNNVPNVQTEGHGGYLVTYLTSDNYKSQNKGSLTELLSWAAEKPDVVLMEYGTNDCWTSSIPLADITDAFSFVVDKFRAQRPDVIFFVAQITPLNPSGCSTCESRVEGLNALIPDWASGKSTPESPVYVVNVWSAFPAASYTPSSTYTSDGAHPNVAGSQLMADVWTPALIEQGIP